MNQLAVGDYYLERYILGELAGEEAEEIRRLASADPEVRLALTEIESSNRDILALYPPSAVKAILLRRLRDPEERPAARGRLFKPFLLRPVITVTSAAAVVLAFVILFFLRSQKPAGIIPPIFEEELALIKGFSSIDLSKTQLLVYRKNGNLVEILADGRQAEKGDLLQLAYVTNRDPYGLILSIDGRSGVTLHFPAEKEGSSLLVLNKKTALPHAIELDDAPGFERFFLITSGFPIDVEEVLKKAQELARDRERVRQEKLDLAQDTSQYSVLILKGEGS
jgi:hypothetical protein